MIEQYASATGIVKYATKLMNEVYKPSALREHTIEVSNLKIN